MSDTLKLGAPVDVSSFGFRKPAEIVALIDDNLVMVKYEDGAHVTVPRSRVKAKKPASA